MVYAGGAWTAGMFFASVLSADVQIPAMLIVLLVSAFFFRKITGKFIYFAVSGGFFIAGALVFTLQSHFVYDSIRSYAGEEILFEGRVVQAEEYTDGKSGYLVRGKINGKTKADINCFVNTLGCGYSDRISFRCTPSGFENTFLFRTKDYYESKGCFLQTNRLSDVQITENKSITPVKLIMRYREYAAKRTGEILPGKYGALITSMLLGEKDGLGENTKKQLYRCGTGHMMAVSGLHLVLIVSVVSAVLERTGINGKRKFLFTEAVIILFVVFSGFTVSVTRAALMMTLICSAELFSRKTDALNSLCIAAFLMLSVHPYLIRNSSFLLSAAGTFGASVLVPYITADIPDEGILNSLRKKIISVFCISVCVFPFSVMFFDEVSVISPVSDIVIIPLCTFALLCGLVSALTGFTDVISYPFLMAGGLASKLVLKLSSLISSTGISSVSLKKGYVPLLTLFLVVFTAFTAYKFRNRKNTLAALVVSAAVFCGASALNGFMNRNVLSVYRVGNGKNAAVAVSMNGCTDIIDITGNAKTSRYVSKLADMCGMHRINSVSFMKNPYQSMASFTERLVLNDVSHVYVPENVYVGYGIRICGCEPEFFGSDGVFIDRGKYTVSATPDGAVTVEHNGHIIHADAEGIDTEDGRCTEQNIAVRQSETGKTGIWKLG